MPKSTVPYFISMVMVIGVGIFFIFDAKRKGIKKVTPPKKETMVLDLEAN